MDRKHSNSTNKEIDDSDEDDEPKKDKNDSKKEDIDIPDKPKKARKVAPKFSPESLNDPNIGLPALYKKVERLNSNLIRGDKESLNMLMRIYQQWIFQLFPADFGDMCNKLNSLPAVRRIVRNFIFDKKGFSIQENDRLLDDFLDDDNENEKAENEVQTPPTETHHSFLNDDDTPDVNPDEVNKESIEQNDNQQMEILDLLGAENPDW